MLLEALVLDPVSLGQIQGLIAEYCGLGFGREADEHLLDAIEKLRSDGTIDVGTMTELYGALTVWTEPWPEVEALIRVAFSQSKEERMWAIWMNLRIPEDASDVIRRGALP